MLRSFRISSWAGVIDINADYNANLVSAEDIMSCLDLWKKFILLILD